MYQQISIQDAKKLLQATDVIIIDIRDLESYQQSHIKNAIYLTVNELQNFCQFTPKNKSILVYCYHGISSQNVAKHLAEQGFEMVYSLIGGYEVVQLGDQM
ncbi:MAG: hypothetical protein ACD_29C00023G0009 [uncultured bacterium]|nr:MAG: hypothetical protein ACD_29C00023G0009 [uncultured bacterium]